MQIMMEARQLLAAQYMASNKPWFAHDILKGSGKQFDESLKVITALLEKPASKYCRYDIPPLQDMIDHDCTCEWCFPHDEQI